MLGDDEEVEEHVILRLPDELAARMHENIEHGTWDNFEYEASETVEDAYTVFLSVDGEEGIQTYPARLVELPCIIEAHKTFDGEVLYKTGDVCQMMLVGLDERDLERRLVECLAPDPTQLFRRDEPGVDAADEEEARERNAPRYTAATKMFPSGITPPFRDILNKRREAGAMDKGTFSMEEVRGSEQGGAM